MKRFITMILVCALLVGVSGVAFAATATATQVVTITVTEVAKIKTAGAAAFTIGPPAAGSEGSIPVVTPAGTNNATAGYTSIVTTPVTHRRTLTASVPLASAPATTGITLSLTATPPASGGINGITGTSAGIQPLPVAPASVVVVNAIGSCYTGPTGVTLLFSPGITDISKLTTGTVTVTVTLTLTDSL